MLITGGSSLAAAMLGPDAAMEPDERMAIEGPLTRIMERLSPEVLETISTVSDPAVLLIALLNWAGRLAQIARARAEERRAEEAKFEPADPGRNGANGHENINSLVAAHLGSDGKFVKGPGDKARIIEGDAP